MTALIVGREELALARVAPGDVDCWLRLASPAAALETPPAWRRVRCAEGRFNDIAAPARSLVAPSRAAVAELLAAARGEQLLITCAMGVSRSFALGYLLACREGGDAPAQATMLRALAPWATPNPLVVAQGDALLNAGGALIRAVASLGRGAACARGGLIRWIVGVGGETLAPADPPEPEAG